MPFGVLPVVTARDLYGIENYGIYKMWKKYWTIKRSEIMYLVAAFCASGVLPSAE